MAPCVKHLLRAIRAGRKELVMAAFCWIQQKCHWSSAGDRWSLALC